MIGKHRLNASSIMLVDDDVRSVLSMVAFKISARLILRALTCAKLAREVVIGASPQTTIGTARPSMVIVTPER